MAPRTRTKNPAGEQTYTSMPVLKQKRLPARRRKVTYKSRKPTLEKRQSTLTQIADFGKFPSLDDIDGISDEDEFEGQQPPKKRRRSSKTKGDSRRDRTLTQMEFVKTPRRTMPVEDSEEEGTLSEEDEIVNEELHSTPHSETQSLNLRRPPRRVLEIADSTESLETIGSISARQGDGDEAPSRDQATTTTMNDGTTGINTRVMLPPVIPQTPKRVRVLAIPSSQTPPTTPLSTQKSPRCLGSGKDRSPLQERSTNIPIMKDLGEDMAELNPGVPNPEVPSTEVPSRESPPVPEFEAIMRETQPIDSPTKKRAREFRAQMDALRKFGALPQNRRKTRTFERGQIIRSSTSVSLVSEVGEYETRATRSKTGESQFSIGEATQAILGGIDLSGEVAQAPEDEQEEVEVESDEDQYNYGAEADDNGEDQDHDFGEPIEEDEQQNTIFEIGEPQEPLEIEFDKLPHRTNEPVDVTLLPQHINPREPSPELPYDNYEEACVPSSQNETPRGTRRIDYDSATQSRHVTFSDQLDTLTLPIPRSPNSTAPSEEEEIDTQESVDAASAQLIYESQAYAALAASSPIEAEPLPIPKSSPVATRHSSQPRFRTPSLPRKNTQVQFAEEGYTQAPSTGPTESISTTSGTYPKSALKKGGRKSQIRSSQAQEIPSSPLLQGEIRSSSEAQQIPSSPSSQRQQLPITDPRTPGIFRFLREPVTASQLIPDSLRSDLDDGIGLPPRWTQDEEEEDDDDDEL